MTLPETLSTELASVLVVFSFVAGFVVGVAVVFAAALRSQA